jgi:hypothetical protein
LLSISSPFSLVVRQVFRVYDNRMVHTDRRPDGDDNECGTTTVCELKDGDGSSSAPLLQWGERVHGSDNRFWLWTFQGFCAVYASDYVEERHAARCPRDFVPVVDHLLALHRSGVVHGDVRCCNAAFGSHLVDYKYIVCSGCADGTGDTTMTAPIRDDWRALRAVLFEHHAFQPPPLPPPWKREQAADVRPSWWKRWWSAAAAAVFHRRPAVREPDRSGPARALMIHKMLRDQMNELQFFAARDDLRTGLVEIEAHVIALKAFLAAAEAARWSVTPVSTKVC